MPLPAVALAVAAVVAGASPPTPRFLCGITVHTEREIKWPGTRSHFNLGEEEVGLHCGPPRGRAAFCGMMS